MTKSSLASTHPVLVVGAGPVGLTAAAELRRRDVPVRCVDTAAGPSIQSRSLAVWPRAMEILRGLGGAGVAAERGLPLRALRYYSTGRMIADIRLRADHQPTVLVQPDVVALLASAFAAAGGRIEWRTTLTALEQTADGLRATLRGPDDTLTSHDFSYVIGADGAHSTVRELLGIPFEGSTHPNTFVLADARVTGPLEHDVAHYHISDRGVLVLVGLPCGRMRAFTSAPPGFDRDRVSLDVVQRLVDERGPGGLTLSDPTWTSAFSVHARHATRARAGRAFLVGDAAHIHSPAGGQGLNTGVADAHNLAWKLAMVWTGTATEALLDSYEAERAPLAQRVIRQTSAQTRLWLLNKRHHVVLRDLALRAASSVHLLESLLVPSMTGLEATYQVPFLGAPRRTLAGHRAGALVGATPVWDMRTARRTALRAALEPMRFTLLLDDLAPTPPRPVRRLLAWAEAECPDLVDLRARDRDGTLFDGIADDRCARSRRRGTATDVLVLVRPDQHVAAVATAADADVMLDLLRELRPAPAA